MTEEYESDLIDGNSFTWGETWIKALTKPSVETYEQIANDPGASAGKAYIWIAVASLISFIVSTSAGGLNFYSAFGGEGAGAVFGSTLLILVCGGIIVPILSVLLFMIGTGITQAIASALGGTGSFSKLAYTYASYGVPLSLVSTGLSIIPIIGLLVIPLGFYGIALQVIAVKAVNQFGWGKAVASSFIILALVLAVVSICVIVFLVMLGPAIGNVFSEIMAEL